MPEPRPQPYIFAHLALPALFFRAPESMLRNFEQEGPEFLRYLWRQIGLEKGGHDEAAGMQIQVEIHKEAREIIGLISLPAPQNATEAFFVAAVHSPERARYFTLELGERLDGSAYTVLCEWDTEGRHLNYGEGPAPDDVRAFLAAIRQHIRQF
ncbi:MAG: hypothetical protein HYZ26_00360 [Chloroflexi bacterium]|nr:hypothetical protein [Chloroflexota bacterium]